MIRIADDPLARAMKENQAMIKIMNDGQDNPKYRALIQTPRVIDYSNVGLPQFEYSEEAIRGAIDGLIGCQIEDEDHRSGSDRSFATIYNADYNPGYGAFVDFEVFRDEYKPVFENIYKNLQNGLIPKKKFSTEITAHKVEKLDNDKFKILRMNYDGLTWTKYPRDPDTGLCKINLNNKIKGDGILTDGNNSGEMIPKSDYDKLESDFSTQKQELDELKNKYKDGETLYTKGKGLYDTLQENYNKLKDKYDDIKDSDTLKTKYDDLKSKYDDIKEKLDDYIKVEEQETKALTNSILEQYPEEERENIGKTLEGLNLSQLRLFNSTQVDGSGLNNTGTGATSNPKNKKGELGKFTPEEKEAVELLNARKGRSKNKSMVRK